MCILVVILLSIKLIYGIKMYPSICVSRQFFPYVTETATCTKRKIYTTKLIQA